MLPNVVICYADADKHPAETLCAGLEAAGIPCWIAPRDLAPNDPPDHSLTAAIAQARVIVLVVSKHANASKSVEREMELAIATDSTPCPVRIEDVPLSDPLTLLVGTVQWFDAIAPPLEQHVDAIAAALKSFLSRPPPLMRAPPQSPDRPLSLESAARWEPSTLDRQRTEQRHEIAARVEHFQARATEFARLHTFADDQIRRGKFPTAREAIAQMQQLKPWDPTPRALGRYLDQHPPPHTSLRAIGSLMISTSSILVGPALFGAVQGMRGAPDSVGMMRISYVVWMLAALLGTGLGIIALLSIHRSANRLRGFRRAWAGTGLGLLMAVLALLAFAGTPTNLDK